MREALSRIASGVELRDGLAVTGLTALAGGGGLGGWLIAGPAGGAALALSIIGAGCFYLGVFHGRRS